MNAPFLKLTRRPGFTMTELLVVIAVIAILAGILLAAMGGVRQRALYTQTESTMQEFSKACEAFQVEHNRYPGAIPEDVLAAGSGIPDISGTENALADLMGGTRVLTPFDDANSFAADDFDTFGTGQAVVYTLGGSTGWRLKADINLMGEGPVLNGTPYAPYFTPSESQFAAARGQVYGNDEEHNCRQLTGSGDMCLPDLLDAWGQPIVYLRRARASGPLFDDGSGVPPQFHAAPAQCYTRSKQLGEQGRSQLGADKGSVLNAAGGVGSVGQNRVFAQILRHTGFAAESASFAGTARGAYALFSAGPDGVYFAVDDGPGTPSQKIGEGIAVDDFIGMGPSIISEFDDVRVFGGG
jgi:prepilin-type N-terminal cleavage/methylation domain-containing protein